MAIFGVAIPIKKGACCQNQVRQGSQVLGVSSAGPVNVGQVGGQASGQAGGQDGRWVGMQARRQTMVLGSPVERPAVRSGLAAHTAALVRTGCKVAVFKLSPLEAGACHLFGAQWSGCRWGAEDGCIPAKWGAMAVL